jgi:hypothetical protein
MTSLAWRRISFKNETLPLLDTFYNNTEKRKENQVPDEAPAKKGFDGLCKSHYSIFG